MSCSTNAEPVLGRVVVVAAAWRLPRRPTETRMKQLNREKGFIALDQRPGTGRGGIPCWRRTAGSYCGSAVVLESRVDLRLLGLVFSHPTLLLWTVIFDQCYDWPKRDL